VILRHRQKIGYPKNPLVKYHAPYYTGYFGYSHLQAHPYIPQMSYTEMWSEYDSELYSLI
jgi:hypothetical protein